MQLSFLRSFSFVRYNSIQLLKNFPENFKKYLEPLERNSQRLYRLTEDILDIARIESNNLKLKKERFEITNLIKETIINLLRMAK